MNKFKAKKLNINRCYIHLQNEIQILAIAKGLILLRNFYFPTI